MELLLEEINHEGRWYNVTLVVEDYAEDEYVPPVRYNGGANVPEPEWKEYKHPTRWYYKDCIELDEDALCNIPKEVLDKYVDWDYVEQKLNEE